MNPLMVPILRADSSTSMADNFDELQHPYHHVIDFDFSTLYPLYNVKDCRFERRKKYINRIATRCKHLIKIGKYGRRIKGGR